MVPTIVCVGLVALLFPEVFLLVLLLHDSWSNFLVLLKRDLAWEYKLTNPLQTAPCSAPQMGAIALYTPGR